MDCRDDAWPAGALPPESALERLKAYIRLDTTNPPGNEIRGASYLAAILTEAGIPNEVIESAPGRASVYARLRGGDAPALVLLHHIDVVPPDARYWDTGPFDPVEKDGYLYGRGSFDIKSLGILHLEAFLDLHRRKASLTRDVIFLAVADEEEGGHQGTGWLLQHRRDLFTNVGYVINEGGFGVRSGGRTSFRIELAQKRPCWLRLIARDSPGHGAMPKATSAPLRLVAALARIQQRPFEPRVVPAVREMFSRMAAAVSPEWQAPFRDIDAAILEPGFLDRLQGAKPDLHALLRNTCTVTMLAGSQKSNVVPPVASAVLDCRILPDQDAGEFLGLVRDRIDDDHITIETVTLFEPGETSADTALYRTIEAITRRYYPDSTIIPAVAFGFNDNHFFRDVGIAAYGCNPIVLPEEDLARVHGNNERIAIGTFHTGLQFMRDLVLTFSSIREVDGDGVR